MSETQYVSGILFTTVHDFPGDNERVLSRVLKDKTLFQKKKDGEKKNLIRSNAKWTGQKQFLRVMYSNKKIITFFPIHVKKIPGVIFGNEAVSLDNRLLKTSLQIVLSPV